MTRDEYYSRFFEGAESTQNSCISSIDDFSGASGCEVAELAVNILDETPATRLVRKALEAGVPFTAEDVAEAAECVKPEFLATLALSATTKFTEEQLEIISCYLSDADYERLCRKGSARSAAGK